MKLFPLPEDSKSPFRGKSWKLSMSDDPLFHQQWIKEGKNRGYPAGANESVVVDIDIEAIARVIYAKYQEVFKRCPIVRTKKGIHAYFAGDTRPRKLVYDGKVCGDIRSRDTYVVFEGSRVAGHEYFFVSGHEWKPLPEFPEELFPDRPLNPTGAVRGEIRNVRNYLGRVVSGRGSMGDSSLVRAAAICRDSKMSESQATIELLAWNAGSTVQPKWKPEEIARAITNVYRKVRS